MSVMPDTEVAVRPPAATAAASDWLEHSGTFALFGVAATVQFSIAIAQALLAIAFVCWAALVVIRRERVEVPRFFWGLLAFAGATLISVSFSDQPRVSLSDSKQLVLLLIVPVAYRFVTASRAGTLVTVLVTCGAASAVLGIVQYGILHYDQLSTRPRGSLGHYMTYSGLLMLVMCIALARVLFANRDRAWPAVVMPAIAVAVALSSTRSAWVGLLVGAALLFILKDFRLVAILPIVAAAFFAAAPSMITARFMSMFDMNDPTIRDRAAMLRIGERMVRAHPLTGVGPNMVPVHYAEYRDDRAVEKVNPHLHNVPLQIAAERGIPSLLAWIAFLAAAVLDLTRRFRAGQQRPLAAAALAAIAAMLTAGLFEYNFGDSEFLMLFLLLVTLPFAAHRSPPAPHPVA